MLNSSNFLAYTSPLRREGMLLSHYYQAEAEHQMVTTDLLQTAARIRARVLIFCADHAPSTFEQYLADVVPAPQPQQVSTITLKDWLPGLEPFSAASWLEIIEKEHAAGLEIGYHSLIVLFEMGWLERANLSALELLAFQNDLTRLSARLQALTVLQFRRDRVDHLLLMPALFNQSAYIFGTRTIRNPYALQGVSQPRPLKKNEVLESILLQFDAIYKDQYRLAKTFENYQVLVDSIPILLANIDRHLHHIFVNQAYADFFHFKQQDLIGQPISLVFQHSIMDRLQGLVERALAGESVEAEVEAPDLKGRRRILKVHFMPQQENEKNRSVIAVCENITDLKESESRIQLLSSGLEALTSGIVITDRKGTSQWVNNAVCQMTQYTLDELIGKSTRVFKSGKQSSEFYENMWSTILSGNTWQGVLINRRKDNNLYYEEMTITPVRANGTGEITHFFAIKQDVTDRKRIEESLQRSEERYRMLVENQGEGSMIVDEKLRFEYVNMAAENILGASMKTLSQMSFYEFTDESGKKLLQKQVRERKKGRPSSYEMTIDRPDGESRHVIITATPRFDSQGVFIGSFAVVRDITERKEMEEELRYFSAHDRLTDLYNRFFFEEEMKRLERGRDFPVSMLVMDMDNLKVTNDTYGHLAGDALLKRLAKVLQDSFRGDDVISRIGGDEFAVILPRTRTEDLERSIQRLRDKIEDANAKGDKEEQIHLSIGGATAEVKMPLVHALEQADLLMYEEKRRKKRDARAAAEPAAE